LNDSEKSLIIKNNPKAYLIGTKECIISNFLAFLKSYASEVLKRKIMNFGGYERVVLDKLKEDINIVIGVTPSVPEKLSGTTFIIGDCAVKYKNRGIFIPGCPPFETWKMRTHFQ
jgi:hypothetical protein